MFTIKVLPDDGKPYTVVARARQVLAWEKRITGRAAVQLVENIHMADLFELAHLAARRDGLYDGDLKTFQQVVDVERAPDQGDVPDGDGDGADPTPPAP